jgi:MFS family permease
MSSDAVVPTDLPPAQDDSRPRLGARFMIPLAVAYFGLWVAFVTPAVLTLQVRVSDLAPDNRAGSLSLVLGVAAVFGMVAMPVAGRLSDRTLSRWGMRRPWLMGGTLVGFAGLAMVAFAGSIPALAVGWCIAQIVFNSTLSVMLALVPDHVPSRVRGKVSGLLGVLQAVAGVVGASVGGALAGVSTTVAILVPGGFGLLCTAVGCLFISDRVLDPRDRPPLNLGQLARSFTFSPRRDPDFGWAWVSRFAIFLAFASVQNYQLYYLTSQHGLSAGAAAALIPAGLATMTAALMIGGVVVGPLSDRLGRRKVFVLGSAVMAGAGQLVLAFATETPAYLVAMVLVGLGLGIYLAVDLALVTEVLPNRKTDAAKDLGVFTVANLLPQSLAPAIAPVFLAIGFGSLSTEPGNNYVMLFLFGTVFAAISAVTVLPIRSVR